jgi:hypothetical protein
MGMIIERLIIAVAWLLPRRLAYWAFVRVATNNCEGNPGEQRVLEPMERW